MDMLIRKETTAKGNRNFARATGNAEIWGTEQAFLSCLALQVYM